MRSLSDVRTGGDPADNHRESTMSDDPYVDDDRAARFAAAAYERDRLAEASGGDDAAADCGLFFAWPAAPVPAEGQVEVEFCSHATQETGTTRWPDKNGQ